MTGRAVTNRELRAIDPSADNLMRLIDESRNYTAIFQNAVDMVPSMSSRFWKMLKMERKATEIEQNRARKAIVRLTRMESEAQGKLTVIHNLATTNHQNANQERYLAVGTIAGLRNQLELRRTARLNAVKDCTDTLAFIRDNLEIELPQNYLDWSSVHIGFYPGEGLSIEERLRHQERWNHVLEHINREANVLTELKIAESKNRWFSMLEAFSHQLLSTAQQESRLITYRFKMLRSLMAFGEMNKLAHFLATPVNGGASVQKLAGEINELETRFLEAMETTEKPEQTEDPVEEVNEAA